MTRQGVALGERGEEVAAEYLIASGYRILARRWRAAGREIDLIAERNGIVAFIEVKTRRPGGLAPGLMAVDHRKQRQIIAAALVGASRWAEKAKYLRFDVVAVTWGPDGPHIDHLEDAFRLEE